MNNLIDTRLHSSSHHRYNKNKSSQRQRTLERKERGKGRIKGKIQLPTYIKQQINHENHNDTPTQLHSSSNHMNGSNKRQKLSHSKTHPTTNTSNKASHSISQSNKAHQHQDEVDGFTQMLLDEDMISQSSDDRSGKHMTSDERMIHELEVKLGIKRKNDGLTDDVKQVDKIHRRLRREMRLDGLDDLLLLCDEYESKGLMGNIKTQFHMNENGNGDENEDDTDDGNNGITEDEDEVEDSDVDDRDDDDNDNANDDDASGANEDSEHDSEDDNSIDDDSMDQEERILLKRLAEIRQRKALKRNKEEGEKSQEEEDGRKDDGDTKRQSMKSNSSKASYDEIYGFKAPIGKSLMQFKGLDKDEKDNEHIGIDNNDSVIGVASIRSTDAAAGGNKYIPPHLRSRMKEQVTMAEGNNSDDDAMNSSKPEIDLQVKRELQGMLNRLSESNIEPIVNSIKQMYNTHSRRHVNTTLCELIMHNISSEVHVLHQLILTYSALIASLHLIVDSSVGAMFVETILLRWHKLYTHASKRSSDSDKAISNLLLLIVYLYNFDVLNSGMIYDIIKLVLHASDNDESKQSTEKGVGSRGGAPSITPLDIELILLIMENCGYHLRKDDASSLKQIILMLQQTTSESKSSASASLDTARVRFMLECVYDVKNNKRKRNAVIDVITPVKHNVLILARKHTKASGNIINTANNDATEKQLMFGLNDLLNIKSTGRWWLTGSAFKRNQLNGEKSTGGEKSGASASTLLSNESDVTMKELQKSAELQHMNSDTRQSIFYVLMSSEDYLDAYEKLSKLKLTIHQQQEIIRVIVECAMNEATYNPFYALLANQFFNHDRHHRLTLQFTVWDIYKKMSDSKQWNNSVDNTRRVLNLATFIASVIIQSNAKHTTLHILKPLDWTSLSLPLLLYVNTLVTYICQHVDDADHLQLIVGKLNSREEYQKVKDGLLFVVKEYVLKNAANDKQTRSHIDLFVETLKKPIREERSRSDHITSEELLV